MKGTIKMVNVEKNFGFIVGEDKVEYFFHGSALKNVTLSELERGREVEFEDAEGTKGPRAEDIYG